MSEVAEVHLRKNVKLSPDGSGQIRIFEVANGRQQKPFSGLELVREVQDSTELFAEEVALDEANVDEDVERIVPVYHFSKEPSRAHGVPFRFVLKPVRWPLCCCPLARLTLSIQCAGREVRRDEEATAGAHGHERQGFRKDEVCAHPELALLEAGAGDGRSAPLSFSSEGSLLTRL